MFNEFENVKYISIKFIQRDLVRDMLFSELETQWSNIKQVLTNKKQYSKYVTYLNKLGDYSAFY